MDDVYEIRPLPVLIANVITPQIEVEDVGEFTRIEKPDVAKI